MQNKLGSDSIQPNLFCIFFEGMKYCKVTAYSHSFATRQLENDTDIYAVSAMLGHTSVNVTDVYLDIDTSKLKLLSLEVPHVQGI